MINFKKYGLRLIYTILSILLSLLALTTIYYFNGISENTYKILKLIILLINIFISSFILGKKATHKGYLEGLKLAGILITIFLILSILTKQTLKLTIIIYYLIITFTSTLGSMIGINKKTIPKNS